MAHAADGLRCGRVTASQNPIKQRQEPTQEWRRTFSFAARPKRFPSFVNVTHDGSVLLPSSMRMVLTLPFSQYPMQLHTIQTGLYVTGCHDTV